MQKCIVGKKIGMTQLFDESGKMIPVTVVEAGPCVVVQKKTTENDGYEAVQLGFGDISEKAVNKPLKGHFAKAGVALKRVLREFRLDDCSALSVGDIIKADTFAVGDAVDVAGVSKGKGLRRHHQAVRQPPSQRRRTVPVRSRVTPVPTARARRRRGSSRARGCRATWARRTSPSRTSPS